MDTGLWAFAAVAAGMIVLPGADFAVVVRGALRSRTDGVATGVGIAAGLLVHTTLAVVGLAAVLVAEPRLFHALQVLGGGYLALLGVRSLRAAARPAAGPVPDGAGTAAAPDGRLRALRHGFLTNALNPKAPVLFLSLLPQFVPPGHAALPRTMLLGAIVVAMGLFWFPTVAVCADLLGRYLRRPGAARLIEGLCGAMLLGLGAVLLVESLTR
ncbi:Threonine/homoserine/homoserine lactone efflux protein [Actinacidiphila alni]|uniref:Threonine/homoserine/homoserine lactone efflux protein n=1 Tax=Actinacidiphila alni TaxID=380248 RepID=A0A1I2B3S9_9ACTN|nr:LysE family translocator [Actinacidiphila alni]SFE49933.1 Threonine/homoserine/homoserine lactone efflux protein [Actinacidiphila alni]